MTMIKQVFVLLFIVGAAFTMNAQITIDGKEYKISEIDVDELSGLAGMDTLPFSGKISSSKVKPNRIYLKNVTIKMFYDKMGGAYAPTLKIPNSLDVIEFINCKSEGSIFLEIIKGNPSVNFFSTKGKFSIDIYRTDSVNIY